MGDLITNMRGITVDFGRAIYDIIHVFPKFVHVKYVDIYNTAICWMYSNPKDLPWCASLMCISTCAMRTAHPVDPVWFPLKSTGTLRWMSVVKNNFASGPHFLHPSLVSTWTRTVCIPRHSPAIP